MSIDPDLVELAKLEVKELLGQRLGDMRGLIIRLGLIGLTC